MKTAAFVKVIISFAGSRFLSFGRIRISECKMPKAEMLNTSTMQWSQSHGYFLNAEHKGVWVISLIDPKCPHIFRELILWCSVFREELKQECVCVRACMHARLLKWKKSSTLMFWMFKNSWQLRSPKNKQTKTPLFWSHVGFQKIIFVFVSDSQWLFKMSIIRNCTAIH